MTTELESIPTRELSERATRTPLEKAIVRSDCFLSIVLIIVAWAAVYWFVTPAIVPALFLYLFALLAVPCVVLSTAKFLSEFRVRHLLRELDRRFGRWSIAAYVDYYQQCREPEMIRCVFIGQGLPHGRRYRGYILFDEVGGQNVEATVSRGLFPGVGQDPWYGTETREVNIAKEDSARLLDLIEKTRGTGKSDIRTMVIDGFPASLAVIFGDGSEATIVSSNLLGLSDEHRQDARINLLAMAASVVCNDWRWEWLDSPSTS